MFCIVGAPAVNKSILHLFMQALGSSNGGDHRLLPVLSLLLQLCVCMDVCV